jgi:hypothetical protein
VANFDATKRGISRVKRAESGQKLTLKYIKILKNLNHAGLIAALS